MIDVISDREHGMVRVKLTGFLSPDQFDEMRSRTTMAMEALGMPPGSHAVLVDLREAPVQAADTVIEAQAFIAGAQHRARRIALVVSSALARMQSRRLAIDPGISVFASVEAAEAWLCDGACPPRRRKPAKSSKMDCSARDRATAIDQE